MTQKKEKVSLHGWLNIDKPEGVSSTYVTDKIKKLLNPKKIGHAGTLDPAASGILPLALGEATKTIEYLQEAKKIYIFTVRFGETTDTLDREGKITGKSDVLPELKQIESILPKFTGKIKQTPPAYSAIKVNGKRAYDLAREGEEFELKEREISIYWLKIAKNFEIKYKDQRVEEITLECECSKGTYIRVLGADIARSLQTIGYITFLRRTAVGNFDLEHAIKVEKTNEGLHVDPNTIISHLKPIDVVLDDIPVLHLDMEACSKLKNGLKIPTENSEGIIRVYQENEKLIALAKIENGFLIPKKVFNL